MVEELSSDIRHRLSEALDLWPRWQVVPESRPWFCAQLSGASNQSFLVTDGVRQWVLRLNLSDDPGIDRNSERMIMTEANRRGLGPGIAFCSREILVTEYISGSPPSLFDLPEIGACFARIHAMVVPILPLDLRLHLQTYYRRIDPDAAVKSCYERVMALTPPVKTEAVVCHHDLLLENMLKTTDGIVVIDWEYARVSEAAYDLAVFSAYYGLGESRLMQLINAYHHGSAAQSRRLMDRIRYFEKIFKMIEILWWEFRGQHLDEKIEHLREALVAPER